MSGTISPTRGSSSPITSPQSPTRTLTPSPSQPVRSVEIPFIKTTDKKEPSRLADPQSSGRTRTSKEKVALQIKTLKQPELAKLAQHLVDNKQENIALELLRGKKDSGLIRTLVASKDNALYQLTLQAFEKNQLPYSDSVLFVQAQSEFQPAVVEEPALLELESESEDHLLKQAVYTARNKEELLKNYAQLEDSDALDTAFKIKDTKLLSDFFAQTNPTFDTDFLDELLTVAGNNHETHLIEILQHAVKNNLWTDENWTTTLAKWAVDNKQWQVVRFIHAQDPQAFKPYEDTGDPEDENPTKQIKEFLPTTEMPHDIAQFLAMKKLLTVFKNEEEAYNFLKQNFPVQQSNPFIDGCQFPIAIFKNDKECQAWAKMALQEGAKVLQLLDKLDAVRKKGSLPKNYIEAAKLCTVLVYKKAEQHLDMAYFCMKNNIDEKTFDAGLKLLAQTKDNKHSLPALKVISDDKTLQLSLLPKADWRGLFLGYNTACCQSLDGKGEPVVRAGYEREEAGFFIVQKGRKGKFDQANDEIVAQSFAFSNDGKDFLFDSIESQQHGTKAEEEIVKLFQKAADILIADYSFERVLTGSGAYAHTPKTFKEREPVQDPTPLLKGLEYSDAYRQVLIAQKKEEILKE